MILATTPAEQFGQLFGGVLGICIMVLFVVWGVLWLFLPFAVFGIKPLLRQILSELRRGTDRRG